MEPADRDRLSDLELRDLLDRLFPNGVAGGDVLAELAPDGWERSPLLACFHPSVERVFEESLRMHRNIEHLGRLRRRGGCASPSPGVTTPEPTIDQIRQTFTPTPVNAREELTELVGMGLWDVFSDNHDVITADNRVADMGSFRGTSAFLDEYLTGGIGRLAEGDYLRFYLGSIVVDGRADLTPIYAVIFRRLKAVGAGWIYHFPELLLVEFGSDGKAGTTRLRANIAEGNARAREAAMDAPPPAIVRAYRAVYGHDPTGWPPA